MLMGATVDEAVSYVSGVFSNPINNTLYELSLRVLFKDEYERVFDVYPVAVSSFVDFLLL